MKIWIKYYATIIIIFIGFLYSTVANAKPNYSYSLPPESGIQNAVYTKHTSANNVKTPDSNKHSDVLKGSVEVQIHPYCQDWNSVQAFNVINHIGTKLIVNNNIDKTIQFVVSEKDEANATTDIHNRISVYKGLLQYVETEDELAFVIGHEMGHVSKNHVKKSILRRGITASAAVAGTVFNAIGILKDSSKMLSTGMILTGSSAAGELVNKKFSRNQETKSDLLSIDYMVNAGYNPLAAISILNKISGNYFDFFSDHPSGEKRIKKAYQYIKETYPDYIEKGYETLSYERALQIINK